MSNLFVSAFKAGGDPLIVVMLQCFVFGGRGSGKSIVTAGLVGQHVSATSSADVTPSAAAGCVGSDSANLNS